MWLHVSRFWALAWFASLSVHVVEAASSPSPRAWVWFEAEDAGGEAAAELSGGRMLWLGDGGAVSRRVEVPEAGRYTLWVRRFWNPQGFRWRVGDEGAWKESSAQTLVDLTLLGGDNGRRVGWAEVGSVDLAAGTHEFRLEALPGERRATAYDCFLLTRTPFQPRGSLKPGERPRIDEPGWFPFLPEADTFASSPIDLRALNEREAGEQGFVRVRGEELIHERTGEPVRFWGVNTGMDLLSGTRSQLQAYARSMARRGVNLVRVHGPIYEGRGERFGQIDTNRVERLLEFVQVLKGEGIYTALSIYFPLWVRLGPENTEFPGYRGQHPFALLYFSPGFQRHYRNWWRHLLTTPNPHTGIALKDDPAVAFVEMVNEDSTLFWTMNASEGAKGNLPDPQRHLLEARFAAWLGSRHPGRSLAEIRSEVWNGVATPQDDLEAGRLGIRSLWDMFNTRGPRDQDTVVFLVDLMRSFHRETYDYLKGTLGCRALVYCSNWKTASARYLDPLDKHANAIGDVFDRHGYFGGLHDGRNAAWNIEAGQTYDDRSALRLRSADGAREDAENPIFDLAYGGKPSLITEINWPLPNRYRADMVLVGAAYGALQGSDGIVWFAAGNPTWEGVPGKFSLQTPVVLGQFPAAALVYRRGLVKTGPRVVDLQLKVSDLEALAGTPLPGPQNFDQLRGNDVLPGGTLTNASAVDSLAFLVGRVTAGFVEEGKAMSTVRDLSPYVDRQARRVRSHTGELDWDWGHGRLVVNAPAAQGAIGFLGASGRVETRDAVFESPLEYGALMLVALDGKPIAESGRVLLQVASEERPHQWATDAPTGRRTLTRRGVPPLLVRNLSGTVRLKRPDAAALMITPLDFNGHRGVAFPAPAGSIALAEDVPYYVIETSSAAGNGG